MTTDEFHEDSDVRVFLGEAVRGEEPPFRGFADGAISRGDAARRRNRILGGAGATLSVAAVIGTFVAVTGVTPPAPSKPAAPATTAHPGDGTYNVAAAKSRDVQTRLPALLLPLLPSGITIGQVPANRAYMGSPNFMLTGPTGTTQILVQSGRLWRPEQDREMGCMQKGSCKVVSVPGGTVYVNDSSLTAKDQAVSEPEDAFQPGMADKVVIQEVTMTFIPTDRSRPFVISESTQVAQMPWADKAPRGYDPSQGPWPPKLAPDSTLPAEDSSGVLLSADDFGALVGKPGLAQVESLLDDKTPPSPESIGQGVDIDKQLAALSAPVLPTGMKLQQGELSQQGPKTPGSGGEFELVGPNGMNYFQWTATPWSQQFADHFTESHLCDGGSGQKCSVTQVPGGRLYVQQPGGEPAKDQLTTAVQYIFMPDDKNSPVVNVSLQTAVKGGANPPIHGMTSDRLLTAEQFVALAKTPGIADVMAKASELVRQ